ncbi:MAG: NADPH-dependent 2,4-dienoyl-CoA reductase [Pseudomonadales bacterium]|nr:NADPH-dependent 2,4-dienoyl-CoA reductase [Pseudomonadales bacterium]
MSQENFDALFTPITALDVTIKNRFIMGSMHTGLEDKSKHFDELATYFSIRAKGGVGLIVTGGFSPNITGWGAPFAGTLQFKWQIKHHKKLTQAVKPYNCKMVLQILHTGRYGYHPFIKSADASKAPINIFKAKKLSTKQVKKQIKAFVNCANLAKQAGYNGVEIMGSEGYFINQFLSPRTNHRDDEYGGCLQNRMRLAVEIVSKIREEHPKNFLIIYRLSMVELVEDGLNFEEIKQIAQAIEKAGASIINTGIGWHEARIPTIVTSVPKAAFAGFTQQIKQFINIPICASNRINTAQAALSIIEAQQADMVSMARPFLADPEIVNKIKENKTQTINHCIACNQACLDHVFAKKRASCLVNPLACYETKYDLSKVQNPKHIAIVGGGPSGMAAAYYAAIKGHKVALYEQQNKLGGQFLLAQRIPGKEDYQLTIDYYKTMLEKMEVDIHLNSNIAVVELNKFDQVLNATGIKPRSLGQEFEADNVFSYEQVLISKDIEQIIPRHSKVAVIGAGGIGFDVCEFLLSESNDLTKQTDLKQVNPIQIQVYLTHWGIDQSNKNRGQLMQNPPVIEPIRDITLLQRKDEKLGKNLGKTTGWVHRLNLKRHGVKQIAGVSYQKIDSQGLHIIKDEKPEIIEADYFVICAGQVSQNTIDDSIQKIGGVRNANQLDAKLVIREALEWAIKL